VCGDKRAGSGTDLTSGFVVSVHASGSESTIHQQEEAIGELVGSESARISGELSKPTAFGRDLECHASPDPTLDLPVAAKFFGRDDHIEEGLGSEHGQRQWPADRVAQHQSLQRLGTRDRLAVGLDQEVSLS
jgi:hypothetical protein